MVHPNWSIKSGSWAENFSSVPAMSQHEFLSCLYCRAASFRKQKTWLAHMKTHLGARYVVCPMCGKRSDWDHRDDMDRKPHPTRCPGFVREEWYITREGLKQSLHWGFGISAQAFDRLWDETPTPKTEALPVPPAAAGVRPPSPTGSSDSEGPVPMPLGKLLNMPDPLGALASHPSTREETTILLLCP